MNPLDKQQLEAWEKRDQAILDDINLANADAVRAHRATGVPMVVWQDGEIRHVSPFDIVLPGEEPRDPGATPAASDR